MGKTGFLGLRIDPELENKINTAAEEFGGSSSEIVRVAVEEFLARKPDSEEFTIRQELVKLRDQMQKLRDFCICNLSWEELKMADQAGQSFEDLLTYGTVNAEFFNADLLDEYISAKKPKKLFKEWKSAIERLAAKPGSYVRTPWQRKRAIEDRKLYQRSNE